MNIRQGNYIVVHTPTLEDFTEIVNYAFGCGYKWTDDCYNSLHPEFWKEYRWKTCISIITPYGMQYADLPYYKGECFNILTMKDFYNMFGGNFRNILNTFI